MASVNLFQSERMMNLDDIQKAILDGESGRAPQKAMELIVRYARVLGAERLCRVSWADLFCGAHHYLDVAGSDDFDRIFSTMSLCTGQIAELKQMNRGCLCYSGVEAATIQQALAGNADHSCITVSAVDTAESVEQLNGNDRQRIDYLSLGCPHYHIHEVRRIAEFLDGRRIHPDTLVHVWTAGPFKYMADRCGYTRTIEKAGAHLLTGSCPSTRGYPAGVRTAAYDSAKQRMSAAQETDARLYYGSVEQCLQTAVSGIWEGR